MPAFTVDADNNIIVSDTMIEGSRADPAAFTTAKELKRLASEWSSARLVAIWNGVPGVTPVRRFTSRTVATNRIWKAIQNLKPIGGTSARTAALKGTDSPDPAVRKERLDVRRNTKTSQVIALLKQPEGATLQTIMQVTAWQAHSVRGFISGQLGKRMGLRVDTVISNGERVYKLKA